MMAPLHALGLATLLIVGIPPAHQAGSRQGPLLTAALAHASLIQNRTPNPIRPSPVHGSRRVRGALIGAFLGSAAGGTIGYVATRSCRCDDPGYGLLIGGPIGALAGAIAGGTLSR